MLGTYKYRILTLGFLLFSASLALGQHPFYLQVREKGINAMAAEDFQAADELLEIAAFGSFEHPDLLADLYVRLVLVQDAMGNQPQLERYLAKFRRLKVESGKPPRLEASLWQRFNRLTGGQVVAEEAPLTVVRRQPEPETEAVSAEPAVPAKPETTPVVISETGGLDDDTATLRLAYNRNPKDLDSGYQLISLLMDEGRLEEIPGFLARLGKFDPNDPRYLNAFARYHYLSGRHQTNAETFARFPDLPEAAAYYLGLSYFQLGRYEEAAKALRGVDRHRYSDLEEVDRRIEAALTPESEEPVPGKKTSQGALHDAEHHYRLNPEDPENQLALIEMYVVQNQWGEAHKLIRKSYRANPDDADLAYFMGRSFLQQGRYDRATKLFYDLAQTGYQSREVYYYCALAAMNNGESAVARLYFEKAGEQGSIFKPQIEQYLSSL